MRKLVQHLATILWRIFGELFAYGEMSNIWGTSRTIVVELCFQRYIMLSGIHAFTFIFKILLNVEFLHLMIHTS